MASNGTQPGYEDAPAFPAGDAPDTSGDLEELARYVVFRGNVPKGTTAEMDDFPATDGVWWSNTDDAGLYRYGGGAWDRILSGNATTSSTVATGWATPSQNIVVRKNGWVMVGFNAAASANKSAGAVCVTVPSDYRASHNVYAQAWGLLGANNTIQVYFEASTGQIKLNQGINSGQSIAVTMWWPHSG